MTKVSKTASTEKQPKAVVVRTSEECEKLYNDFTGKVNLSEWMSTTKNGAYKLSESKPENDLNNKGSLKVGNTVFYLVPVGANKFNVMVSFNSYLKYILKREAVAQRLANFPTFEDWCNKQNQWKQLEAVGVVITDEQKRAAYDTAKAKLGETDDDTDDESEE